MYLNVSIDCTVLNVASTVRNIDVKLDVYVECCFLFRKLAGTDFILNVVGHCAKSVSGGFLFP